MSITGTPFELDLPPGWEDQTIYTYRGPDDGDNQHFMTLVVDKYAGGVELDEYANEHIDVVLEALQGAEVLKREARTIAGGRQVFDCVIKWIPADSRVIFRKLAFLIEDGQKYCFACNFTKKTFKTIGRQMDQIIDSLKRPGEE